MPIPAAAGVIASVVHGFQGHPFNAWTAALWMLLVGFLGFLMVSTWRFWSGKEINLANRHPFQLMVLIGSAIALLVYFSRVTLLLMALAYMFSGVLARAAYSRRRHRKQEQTASLAPHLHSTSHPTE
jgi:CDP-diacylglycerol---serine O-phosphatidyltransferase